MGVIMKNKVNYTGGGGGSSTLADLEDVELTTPTDGQALVYDADAQKWVNGESGGIDGVFIDTNNVIQAETLIPASGLSYTATEDCFVYLYVWGSKSTVIKINNIEIGGNYSGDKDVYLIPLKKGQVLTTTSGNANNTYTVFGVQVGTTHSKFQPIIYSEEEREVGVWIDGKPLYQKTIDGGLLYNDSNEHDIAHNVLNLDHVVDIRTILIGVSNNAEVPAPNYRTSSQTGITVTRSGDYLHYRNNWQTANAFKIWFTIQYTKTTDTAGSGVWTTTGEYAHHYSTTEHVIGTWIDGKTLYERTIFTNPTWNNNSASIPLTNEICKNIEGGVCDANGENLIPFGYGSINEYVRLYQAGNILSLYNSFTSSRAYVQITIRYTKSS